MSLHILVRGNARNFFHGFQNIIYVISFFQKKIVSMQFPLGEMCVSIKFPHENKIMYHLPRRQKFTHPYCFRATHERALRYHYITVRTFWSIIHIIVWLLNAQIQILDCVKVTGWNYYPLFAFTYMPLNRKKYETLYKIYWFKKCIIWITSTLETSMYFQEFTSVSRIVSLELLVWTINLLLI